MPSSRLIYLKSLQEAMNPFQNAFTSKLYHGDRFSFILRKVLEDGLVFILMSGKSRFHSFLET